MCVWTTFWTGLLVQPAGQCFGEIDHLHEHFLHDWLRVLKNSDHYNGEKPSIFHINLIRSHAFFSTAVRQCFIIIIIIKQIDISVQQRFGKKIKANS